MRQYIVTVALLVEASDRDQAKENLRFIAINNKAAMLSMDVEEYTEEEDG